MDANTQQERGGAYGSRAGLLVLVAAMVAFDVALGLLERSTPALLTSPAVPVWTIAIAFAIAIYVVIDIPTQREKYSINIAELPIVFSLFFLTPVATVAAFVVGAAFTMIFSWRQRGVKLVFNFAQFSMQVLMAVFVFRLVLGHASPLSLRAWIAAGVACLASDAVSVGLVSLAVWLHSGSFQRDVTLWTMATSSAAVTAKTAIALLAVIVLEVRVANAVVLVLIVTAVMYLCFRAYAFLYLRYQRVEMLYRFTGAIAGAVETAEISERVVREARALLRAEAVELVLYEPGLIVTIDDLEKVSRRSPEGEDPEAAMDTLLALHGEEYALITSLGSDARTGWLAVVRGIDDQPFDVADRRLFEALANHTSVAVENGRLLDQVSAAARQREHRALHDALTELPNRVHLTDVLNTAINDATPRERVALLIVGLDNFRDVNETLGHEHGDTVLREVATRLRETSQGDWTAARVGGDEFAILVPDAGAVGAAVRIGESIVRAFEEQPFRVAGLVIELSVRVGVALTPDHGASAEEILRRAEIALRTAKVRHAQVNAFLLGDDPHTPRQLVLAHELRRAIEDEALAVYVQPQLDLDTGQVRTVEALARWQRDDQVIPPDEFIPVAERTGLIRPLTAYILDRSLEHRRQWAAAGYDIDIAVNVSVRDLVDPAFPEQVAVALTRAVCPARALRLEITETQIMAEPRRVAAALRRLAILGVEVSIDDFGTGYSSLSSVRELAVDEVKIDRSFVSNAANDHQDGTLVKSITELGHGLGLRVVAEGVEDDATLELLRAMGVDAVQGFGISRPIPAVDLPGWLAYREEPAADRSNH